MSALFNNSYIYANGPNSQYGSVGGFFTLGGNSQDVFGITNYHVVEKDGSATEDAPVFRRGSTQLIGRLKYWFELEPGEGLNFFDLALFNVNKAAIQPLWNLPVSGFAEAATVSQVQMVMNNNIVHVGVSAGLLNGPFNIGLEHQEYKFGNLLQIQSSSDNNAFSSPGDSGSIILSGDKIVALLLGADSNNPLISYGIPFIDNTNNRGILNYFDLKPLVN
ncbi:MAG TPA: hypothetical protein VNS58_08520 [Puia sp.]|nr:hypothetical protein [Puia sp.]